MAQNGETGRAVSTACDVVEVVITIYDDIVSDIYNFVEQIRDIDLCLIAYCNSSNILTIKANLFTDTEVILF